MDDFIYVKRNGIPRERCNEIINLFEQSGNKIPGTIGGKSDRIDEELKKCTEEFIMYGNNNNYDSIFISYLNNALGEYKSKYPHVNRIDRWSLFTQYKVQKYNPNEGYFALHCENCGSEFLQGIAAGRMLVWMIYLNDVTEGGYTVWPQQERVLAPKCGDIVIWPPYWTHPHQGITSKTQTKYILTGWYNYVEYSPEEQEKILKESAEMEAKGEKQYEEWLAKITEG